jgi:hypothetical protein
LGGLIPVLCVWRCWLGSIVEEFRVSRDPGFEELG